MMKTNAMQSIIHKLFTVSISRFISEGTTVEFAIFVLNRGEINPFIDEKYSIFIKFGLL
tara:strand:+ start:273564 stop:273740 length:177 start_codon:yes stop_codon:yes gene_type:complete